MVSHLMEPAPSGAGAALLLLACSWSSRAALSPRWQSHHHLWGIRERPLGDLPHAFFCMGWHEQGTVKWGWALGTPG